MLRITIRVVGDVDVFELFFTEEEQMIYLSSYPNDEEKYRSIPISERLRDDLVRALTMIKFREVSKCNMK